jgi:hypothetical protein
MSRIDDCRKDCEVPDCAYQINGDESACEKCTKPIELRGYFDIPVLARCGTYKLKPKNIEQLLPPYIILYDERGFIVKIDQKELDSANARIKELMRETDTLRQCIIDRLIETGSTEVFGNYDNYNLVALLVKEKNRRLQKLVEAATNLTDECFELESICEGDECRGNWKLFVDQYVRPIEQAIADAKGEQ